MVFIAPKHEGACAQGLRATNAMHPERSSLYAVGIATIDTHTTLEKKEKIRSSYLKQTHKPLPESGSRSNF
jgi:hypothetical protein